MDKTELPTPTKLAELRELGILPLSIQACRAAFSAGVLLSLLCLKPNLSRVFAKLTDCFSFACALPQGMAALRLDLATLLVVPPLAGWLCAVVFGLLQTRFFFQPSQLAPRLDRLAPWKGGRGGGGVIILTCGQLVLGVLLLLVSGELVVNTLSTLLFSVLNGERIPLTTWSLELAQRLIWIGLTLSLLGAVLIWLLGLALFYMQHRMPRSEVLGE